ncbi:hypothetical protein Cs7R123_13060 [Catellatospora sp. TT07R-123]|uniref:hypothetical protein n=1 Tax=Catellatospora sp. TT07R-123 TaxID=2733863 RepID=UPI001B29C3DA|nr:hypothetical protein [Catellatospora sp. TT07R-123]GHJ43964.1 hypothetical protein Cs7R123_13060 [Catellatospora sp. TT07R-123]
MPPRWPVWPYRLLISLTAVLLLLQAVLAGQFLSGIYASLAAHAANATFAGFALLAAAFAAILLRWPGRGPWWPMLATAGLFLLTGLQIGMGYARLLAVHIPLGVSVILLAAFLTVWSWRYRPARAAAPGAPVRQEAQVAA